MTDGKPISDVIKEKPTSTTLYDNVDLRYSSLFDNSVFCHKNGDRFLLHFSESSLCYADGVMMTAYLASMRPSSLST